MLFDTGASALFKENAGLLDVSLDDIDFVVLSHGHFDHGGGLRAFLTANTDAPVYLKEEAFGRHYIRLLGIFKKYIGLDQSLLGEFGRRFSFVREFTEIDKGIYLLPAILNNHARPLGNRKLFTLAEGHLVPDGFAHELMLVVREQDGLVVLTGCSHSGILNMIESVEAQFTGETIKAVLGGFHLTNPVTGRMAEKREDVAALGRRLRDKPNLMRVYTGHCTGEEAYGVLESEMGEKLARFSTGLRITV